MYFFSCFLQYNLRGAEMLFEIQKKMSNNKANALAFLFETTFLHLGGYSATNTITHALFLNWVIDCSVFKAVSTISEPYNGEDYYWALAFVAYAAFSIGTIPTCLYLRGLHAQDSYSQHHNNTFYHLSRLIPILTMTSALTLLMLIRRRQI